MKVRIQFEFDVATDAGEGENDVRDRQSLVLATRVFHYLTSAGHGNLPAVERVQMVSLERERPYFSDIPFREPQRENSGTEPIGASR